MENMKKALIIHSMCDPINEGFLANSFKLRLELALKQAGINELSVDTLDQDLALQGKPIPRGYDAYLVHPSDILEDDLKSLRNEQPASLVYALNRQIHNSTEQERKLYTNFVWGTSLRELEDIARTIVGNELT